MKSKQMRGKKSRLKKLGHAALKIKHSNYTHKTSFEQTMLRFREIGVHTYQINQTVNLFVFLLSFNCCVLTMF